LRERERSAQHVTYPVEAPVAPVLAELFTPHSVAPTAIDSTAIATTVPKVAALESPANARPATIEIDVVLPSRRSLREQPAVTPPRVCPARGSKVTSKRIRVSSAELAPSGPPRRRAKAFASKAFSGVAMLFAVTILVGLSVPSNVFDNSDAIAAVAAPESDSANVFVDSRQTQSLAVSDEVVNDVARQDGLKVISSAEVLALKFAGIEYEYNATVGPIRWPFPYSVPTTDQFGDRVGGFHKGTDFAAAAGTPIYAIADGVVTFVQSDYSGYGYHVEISHEINGEQIETLYAHMTSDSSPLVVGDKISVGDFVGLVGDTGRSYGAHLHLEIHLDEVPVDPYAWLTANASN
jgi:murein DD-endopeptidase MepM/ murein hydrolase activator NlpD